MLTNYLILSSFFFLGACVFCLERGLRGHNLVSLIGISLVGFFAGLAAPYQNVDDPEVFRLIMAPAGFLVTFGMLGVHRHRDLLMRKMNEGEILSVTVIFLYLGLTSSNPFVRSMSILVLPFASIPVLSAITHLPLNQFFRGILSLWMAFVAITIGFFQALRFASAELLERLSGPLANTGVLWAGVDLFFLGSGFIIAMGYMAGMMGFLPSKESSLKEDLRNIKATWSNLANTVDSRQMPRLAGLALAVFNILPLALNSIYDWIPRGMAVSISFSLVPVLMRVSFVKLR